MTIRYSHKVRTSTFFFSFRVLFKWKGSIWKSVAIELIVWSFIYFTGRVVYTFVLNEPQREVFEDIVVFCNNYSSFLPITFMLAFYVSAVFSRWQKIFDNIGWIDTSALIIAAHVKGTCDSSRLIRRSIIRYLVFVQALVFRNISAPVNKRFPTLKHLVDAGFISSEELNHYNSLETTHTKYYLPMQWTFSLVGKAKDMGFITSDMAVVQIKEKLDTWRESVVSLTHHDWVQIPLAYTQVVSLAVISFFVAAIMGRQFIHPKRVIPGFVQPVDPIVPVMSMLEFVFIFGWTKVAETMLNPMGEDDDDLETNYILDRNLQVGLALVDSYYGACPPLKRDHFWEKSSAELVCTPEDGKHRSRTDFNERDNRV